MGRPKVLLLGEIEHAHASWGALSELADLVQPEASIREEFLDECRSGKLDGVLVTFRTFNSVDITGLFDEELIKNLPASLKFICHNGAGYDQIDVHACTERGIRVSNTPTAVDDATADANVFLILGALRGFNTSMFALREGKWRGHPPPPLGHDPQGKTLGILGMGGIGRNLKRKVEAFDMKVIYYNRTKLSDELSGGAEYVSFDELLERSDVLSLNLPLNKHTRHIISKKEFEKMKRGVVIVNTARGAVIDEAALAKALDSGKVWSCGLDVFEDEPKIHPGLVANPHVMLLPHMGTWTVETQTKMEEWNIGNVRAVLERGELNNVVPEQAGS
ncbi:glyoxylate reductase [Trichodelitschia bisporula]|uniref:Glyoxylate reductase n=1 Tax=Trichodelitschia bisporula TaxID=703511 RepID=A0A6G1HZM0_9PEZI|nr:glyoxylate reductase [Trichodelitschia bisporula]